MKVVVIGAAGHVGLPFSLVLDMAGHEVLGLDLNQEAVDMLNAGKVSFIEQGAEEILAMAHSKIVFTTDPSCLNTAELIAVMIGTPVDEEGNPRIDDIVKLMEFTIAPQIVNRDGIVVMLRSTVSPGTTDMLKRKLEATTLKKEGIDFHLVFCPERVAQGAGIVESMKFPQLIGTYSDKSYETSKLLFANIAETIQLRPIEAELGKLMTNMYRYVNFALSNEFMMIAESYGANTKKIFEAVNKDYPRVNLPMPGPNVGGPCLFKDGKFLLDGIPYPELIRTSFDINEGMPDYIWRQMMARSRSFNKVLILGASFKAENDDTRNSLSFKMKKVLEKHGVQVTIYDPYVEGMESYPKQYYNAVIVMTPHKAFKTWLSKNIFSLPNGALIVDLWKLFPESENFNNGIYTEEDYRWLRPDQKHYNTAMQGE